MPSLSVPRGGARRHLTLQQKVLIIEKREREGLKQDELAQWAATAFSLPCVPSQPTISNILKDKDKLREALRLNPARAVKSVREVTCQEFEEAVVQWILDRTATSGPDADPRPVDRRSVLEYASIVRDKYPRAKDLALSEGWLSRLLERRCINLRPGENEEIGEDEQQRVEEDDVEEAAAQLASSMTHSLVAAHADEYNQLQSPPAPPVPAPQAFLPTPRRTSASRAFSLVASPPWSEVASPVFTSSPVRMRTNRSLATSATASSVAVSSSMSSGHQSPAGLRSLAHAASPDASSPRNASSKLYEQVCEYYGSQLKATQDLRTNAPANAVPRKTLVSPRVREILAAIPETVTARAFGCGFPIPLGIEGLHALDLGCGSGRDAYLLSALVGATGSVTGVDMTPQLLDIAEHAVDPFTARLQVPRSSLHFVHGYMDYLDQAGIEDGSIDLTIANFSVSLTPDKKRTMREVFRVLRPGGEFQISDIYASRRVPVHVRDDTVLFCEGLGGAMYVDDFTALCREVGFGEPRQVSVTPLAITDVTLASCVGAVQYYSITYRCFKVSDMELRATEEDYGHVAKYLGTIPGSESVYELDANYTFEARRPIRVGGNTAATLTHSWLARHFHVNGDWSEHFGRFTRSSALASIFP